MSDHEIVAEGKASDFDVPLTVKEIKCGNVYYLLDAAGNYCPNCGEKL